MVPQASKDDIFNIASPFHHPLLRQGFLLATKPFERILCLRKLNRMHAEIRDINPTSEQFFDQVLSKLDVQYGIHMSDWSRIPDKGRVVVVANHPFGGIEGIILLAILKRVRQDVRVLANSLLKRIPKLDSYVISVNPFGGKKAQRSNIRGIREAMEWLEQDGLLLIFPSGEVSHRTKENRTVTDPEWSPTIARLIRRSDSPVLPVYFSGSNGRIFQMMGLIHPRLRTLMLPRELLNKQGETFDVKIGNLITHNKLSNHPDDQSLIKYLRKRTYFLGSQQINGDEKIRDKEIIKRSNFVPICPAVSPKRLLDDIYNLPYGSHLVRSGDLSVYIARAEQIPDLLLEIGRLREITFRGVGEGTGKAIDLDQFDNYYRHLILWDHSRGQLVGSYRLGQTDEIIRQEGIEGLYTSTLFNIRPELFECISPVLELGRSFIQPEYQKNFAPLMLLWKGIGTFVAQNPQYCCLFGPVSISNDYKPESRQILVDYLERHQNDVELARYVEPKTPFPRLPLSNWEVEALYELLGDLDDITSLISDLETQQKRIPVLLRQYLKLGGKIIGFNVDPSFNNVLDGLILVDLRKTDRNMLNRYMGKDAAEAFSSFHNSDELVLV